MGATDATKTYFNATLFDERCAELGAINEDQRAALVGVDRTTLYRFRRGEMSPRLEVARRLARSIGVTTDDLWKEIV